MQPWAAGPQVGKLWKLSGKGGRQGHSHNPCLLLSAVFLCQEPPSLNKVFRTLGSEDIPDLPPGGGLCCM